MWKINKKHLRHKLIFLFINIFICAAAACMFFGVSFSPFGGEAWSPAILFFGAAGVLYFADLLSLR